MEIRKAVPADSMTLGILAARMWEHDPAELEPEFAELTASDEAACFLAFKGDTAVGFAQCQLRHDYVEGCETSRWGSWRAFTWLTNIGTLALQGRC